MKSLSDIISIKTAAIKSPSTWTDERAALRTEVREMKAALKTAKSVSPELLAIVRDLAFGSGVSMVGKVINARAFLRQHNLVTHEEHALGCGATEETNFYNEPLYCD